MIDFDNVSMRYDPNHTALSNLTFHMAKGEMAFLTGHSGAGKSTLLKLAALLERPTNGKIVVNGCNYKRVSRRKIPYIRRNIGLIFQNPHLLPELTVFDNVALPLVIHGFSHQEIQKRVRAALDKVSLGNKERCYPKGLSGGEQQRVGIARAVVNRPALLLADEPTGNLDPDLSAEIMNLFQEFNEVGVTVLVASHDLPLIASMRHRIITLKQGRLFDAGAQLQWQANHVQEEGVLV